MGTGMGGRLCWDELNGKDEGWVNNLWTRKERDLLEEGNGGKERGREE